MNSKFEELLKAYLNLSENDRYNFQRIINSIPTNNIINVTPQTSSIAKSKPMRPIRHPLPKSYPDGRRLADSIKEFADNHRPPLKYLGMHTALDVLTACYSLSGEPYDFHYEIRAYKSDGIYIEKVSGIGHRTSPDETDKIERGESP